MSTTPIHSLTDTWNAGGTTFTGIGLNVTDTASAAGSLLLNLQVGGVSQFSVSKAGVVNATNSFRVSTTTYGGGSLTFSDVTLLRDGAANILAQRSTTNAQTFRVYNTFTATDNFQRLAITSASTTLSALSGASVTATGLIPDGAVVVGVTTRVSTLITGATGYQVGTVADPDRWGDITGTAVGTTSDNTNWTAGTIECFTSASDVVITANGSNFTAGAIVVSVHYVIGQAD